MANEKLIQFIKQSLKIGKSRECIQNELVNVGWTQQDITDAFTNVLSSQNQKKSIYSPFHILEESLKIYTASFFKIIGIFLIGLGVLSIPLMISGLFIWLIVIKSIDNPSLTYIGSLITVVAILIILSIFVLSRKISLKKGLLLLGLIVSSVISICLYIFTWLMMWGYGVTYSQPPLLSFVMSLISTLLAFILLAILHSWIEISIIKVLKSFPTKTRLKDALKISRTHMFDFIIIQILFGICIGILIIIADINFSLYLLSVGLLVHWSLLIKYIYISEEVSLITAIKKSLMYVRGNIFTIIIRQLPLFIAILLAGSPLIANSYPYLEGSIARILYFYPNVLLILFIPLWYIYQFLVYKSLENIMRNTISVKRKILDVATVIGIWILISMIIFIQEEIFYWLFY